MPAVNPDVIVISSDEEDDGDVERNLDKGVQSERDGDNSVFVISSDDDGETNLDEGLESEHDSDCIELDGHEADKEEGDGVEKPNEQECPGNCDRSGSLNQGDNDLQELSLDECKTYLRKRKMRVSATKEECIQRIKEHGRLKDGNGKSLYPISSFSINCTGDACRGDVVMFKQDIYDNHWNIIGRRTVAGRIANEYYAKLTQQHTFLVEVLWSDRPKKLKPLSILQVKGRNLYRLGTFRQPWESEEERSHVLREKHERGKAARHKRKLRETQFASGDYYKGTKRRKISHRGPYQSKCITQIDKQNDVNKNTTAHTQAVRFQNMELERSNQPTNHSDPNSSMYSDQHLQDASLSSSYDRSLLPSNLLPFGFAGDSQNDNGQQGPNKDISQPPVQYHDNHKPPVYRSTDKIAKSLFPKSSFSINCTGDARIGDVVLFKQEEYFRKEKNGKKRTVAGRIVKVKHCVSKDKDRFLIKVLWTTPSSKNPWRSPLQVRSLTLYKFGTFRRPWRNEANRSKMFEEKHGPAMLKQKMKKKDIAVNINKGAKRQKVSHDGTLQCAKQKKKAEQKSSKRKGASATPLKETKTGPKKKAVQVQKKKMKKSKQKTFHQNLKTILNPSVSNNPNLISDTSPNPNSCQTPNLTPNLKTLQSPTLNKPSNPNPNKWSNPYPNTRSNRYPNTRSNRYPNTRSKANLNKRSKPYPNTRSNPYPNTRSNPSPVIKSNPSTDTELNPIVNPHPNPHPSPNKWSNPNLNTRLNPSANAPSNPCADTQSNPSGNAQSNPNTHPNPHPIPNLNRWSNPNPNTWSNPSANAQSNPSVNTHLNPHPNPYLNRWSNHNPNTWSNPSANTQSSPSANTNSNRHPNLNSHPNPNSYICPDLHPHEPSLSLPYNRTFMPNPPPFGSLQNQRPVWHPPNQPQPPFGFPGYGGQWGSNHAFNQSPGYYAYNNLNIVLGMALMLQRQQR